ncbi:MAG: deferrochelatase/peroxidase EfeB [Frankiaceae bacterium]|jgi:deferrochelatase/peroxidase EfeB|nr:deferrochelatase/peroxidase EfeB [Frankiaceae bacterium]MDQ1673953.1 deferrochelatase/peroxidase EfeB [Frankiaceae bacterium]
MTHRPTARPPAARTGPTRRGLLGWFAGVAGVGVAGSALAGCSSGPAARGDATTAVSATSSKVDFHGAHQAGIATPAQDRLHFAAFDLLTTDKAAVVAMLRAWSDAAARMSDGRPVDASYDAPVLDPAAAPGDTGEADGLNAARLTITIGFGRSMFTKLGLTDRLPPGLVELPAFPGERLDARRSDGDIAIQACADDPQVAVHAIRNLVRLSRGTASLRWSQLGFGRTSSNSSSQATPRNLFGFKDGTANLRAEDPAAFDRSVWVAPDEAGSPAWMAGGSYLVARRIRMLLEVWDRTSLGEQEQVIGRHRLSGAPLGAAAENDPIRLAALPADSHVRLAHPDTNGGAAMVRRGYSFVDENDSLGRLDAGLFFLAYVRDPRTQFVPIMQKLAQNDAMNEYLSHVGSGLWAVPPGVQPGGYWGSGLFA